MKISLKIISISNNINAIFGFIARYSILLMIILGFWNVIGRYLGVAIGRNLSSNMLIEGQWYLFSISFLLGLGWTLQNQEHVRVDILQTNWRKKRKIKIELLGTLILLLPFSLSIIILSIQPTLQSWAINESSPDPGGIPRYWIKTAIPIGFTGLALQGIAEAMKSTKELKKIHTEYKNKAQKGKE